MSANIRLERIEKLLYELKYEITRGMMDREIEEEMGFEFLIPVSKHFPRGVVFCQFHTRPMADLPHRYADPNTPKLRVVKGNK
jgi:hypothetical protein